MVLKDYAKALPDFEKAVKLTNKSPNPLYLCNKANALYSLEKIPDAMKCFKETNEINKSAKATPELSEENISYINKTMKPFITQLEAMNNVQLTQLDPVIAERQKKFISKFLNRI